MGHKTSPCYSNRPGAVVSFELMAALLILTVSAAETLRRAVAQKGLECKVQWYETQIKREVDCKDAEAAKHSQQQQLLQASRDALQKQLAVTEAEFRLALQVMTILGFDMLSLLLSTDMDFFSQTLDVLHSGVLLASFSTPGRQQLSKATCNHQYSDSTGAASGLLPYSLLGVLQSICFQASCRAFASAWV